MTKVRDPLGAGRSKQGVLSLALSSFNLRIINAQALWNPQIAGLLAERCVVVDHCAGGFHTGPTPGTRRMGHRGQCRHESADA